MSEEEVADDAPVLGIDLGTTFSAMALVNHHGKPEIVTNAEGHPTTPSVVHFYDEDACVVGDEAVKMVVIDPENVVRFIKRHMGEEDFTLEFFGRAYTPQEISALILRKLKEDAEELLGVDVEDVVITVPAYFNSAQRGATAEAGAIAGLNVLSIINEPTAAAIAYGLDRIGGQRKLLVLDLGGGTFDVTCMAIEGTKLTTLASDGNAELGGKDWDDRLLNHVAEEFFEKYQLDPRDDAAPYQELYERCLHAKISLSTKDRAMIPVNYRGKRLAVKVTRELFEELTADLVQQCEDTSVIVLEKAKLTWEDLDDVLLVGGSTRMPMIRNLLVRLSGKEPAEGVNPDECVALGASLAGVFRHRPNHPALMTKRETIKKRAKKLADPAPAPAPDRPRGAVIGLAYGGHVAQQAMMGLTGSTSDSSPGLMGVEIEDATTHPLGLVVLNKQREEVVYELIPEGTRLPHEKRGTFAYAYENMRAVRVEVTEGTGTYRDEVTVIGKVELTGLPPRPKGTPIEVVYTYGVDQILKVQVVDIETGIKREVDIRFQGGLTGDQVSAARARNERMDVD
ncbi:MAG: Hsp70 family protein [Alphaproteobacteria bacterium]|nr:Hsp70 family protein [Alphaproteobacteria bacterium]MCB9690407.1 Hsp70 family protein [Alphaproteobacteria bacterium]